MRSFTVDERRNRLAHRHFLAERQGRDVPGLDITTMGWSDRDFYLGAHRAQVFDTNGNAGPTAWWNGRVVGGWYQDPTAACSCSY